MPKKELWQKPENKKCPRCGKTFPYTEEYFTRDRTRFFGLRYRCKSCQFRGGSDPAYTAAYRRRNMANGTCKECGQPRLTNSGELCEEHWYRRASWAGLGSSRYWRELRSLAEKQSFKCAYTGILLVPCWNMSLDHIVPVSKSSDLAHNIENVQWVTKEVNMAKQALSHDQFVALCRLVCAKSDS
jgi:5-methylcytosine-specific restriction endonuclease McrA